MSIRIIDTNELRIVRPFNFVTSLKCLFGRHRWNYFLSLEENLKRLDKELLIGESDYDTRVCVHCGKSQEIVGEYYSDWDRGYLWE